MNRITISSITKRENRIEVFFDAIGAISRYFNKSECCFWTEYSFSVENVPDSIAIIPFLSNILPIVWLTNATIFVNELDEEFWKCLPEVKHGYILQAKNFSFKGEVICTSLVNNKVDGNNSAVLFSGGVDAFATLFNHIDQKPTLITYFGADISLDDITGRDAVKDLATKACQDLGLGEPVFASSNFRNFIDERMLNYLVEDSNDSWWHAFQHGLAFCGLAAPIAYIKSLKHLYIASSYTCDSSVMCASDPVIDSHVRFASSYVTHDGYYMGRIDKIRKIVQTCTDLNISIYLRVCWKSKGGVNCSSCEKCIRTIYNILCVGGDPNDFGFSISEDHSRHFEGIVKNALLEPGSETIRPAWQEIKSSLQDSSSAVVATNSNLRWIYSLDTDMKKPLLFRAYVFFVRHGIRILKRVRIKKAH